MNFTTSKALQPSLFYIFFIIDIYLIVINIEINNYKIFRYNLKGLTN